MKFFVLNCTEFKFDWNLMPVAACYYLFRRPASPSDQFRKHRLPKRPCEGDRLAFVLGDRVCELSFLCPLKNGHLPGLTSPRAKEGREDRASWQHLSHCLAVYVGICHSSHCHDTGKLTVL